MNNISILIDELIKESINHDKIYKKLEVNEKDLISFKKLAKVLQDIKNELDKESKASNYIHLFFNQLEDIRNHLSFLGYEETTFVDNHNSYQREQWIKDFNDHYKHAIAQKVNSLSFQINFFKDVGYLDSNLVLIGANGSGKTSLSNKFKDFLNNNGVVISAQRILKLPSFEHISNPEITERVLREVQTKDKTYKDLDSFHGIDGEFGVVLQHLISEYTVSAHKYRTKAINESIDKQEISAPEKTNLDKSFEIWNSLIEHRYLKSEDGINIKTYTIDDDEAYESIRMSDGEKVLLYLVAQVLQAPKDGFIVVDEPEMYLHKSILNKLWDVLEGERNDCKFFYLTHDLDFASSRKTANKIWIKSYTHPDDWDLESIPENEIPEPLLLELLGSRKNILFCEGIKGSNDEKIYSLLFPNYTITPVGSCFEVINHTKAFNKLKGINTTALGLIDSDHHSSKRLNKLEAESVFSFSVSEVENLFLDEEFLTIFAESTLCDCSKIDQIKVDVVEELRNNKELQISNYISTKINNIFTDTDLSKGNCIEKVKENYEAFLRSINIDDFYEKRKIELEDIISSNDYKRAISVFNNKGLKRIASKYLAMTDFTERAFKLLQSKPESLEALKKYFPSELFLNSEIQS